jgi:4-amino-4-deoxy-L-arabinose transferase-like glycosyltransferase
MRRKTPAGIDAAALCLLALLAGPILFRELGGGSLAGDETIFAQVGREASRGALLPLRFGGTLFLHKPPLFPWLVGLDFRLLGVSEGAARLPSALSGVALVLLVYLAGAALFSRLAGAVAALVLLTNYHLLFVHGLRKGVADGPLTLVLSAALLLYLGHRTGAAVAAGRTRLRVVVAAGLLLGLGLLLKSGVALLGVAVVGLFVFLFPLPGEGRLRSLPRCRDPLLLAAVSLALFLPWFAAMGVATHGAYPRYLFGVDILARATQGIDPTHLHRGLYWRVLQVDFRWKLLFLLPIPLLLAWRRRTGAAGERPEGARLAFLALWLAVVLGVFSSAVSKLPWYIYPAYPALALLLGWSVDALVSVLPRRVPSRVGLAGWVFLALVGAVLARGLWRSFQEAGEDVARVDAKRIEIYLDSLGRPATCVEPGTVMREWNFYYLHPLWGRYVHSLADASGCEFLITRSPAGYLPPGELARRAWQIRKLAPREGDVWLLSLRRDLPEDLLHAPAPPPEAAY